MKYTIYCDGSARNNGYENAVGAWAYVVLDSNGEVVAKNCEAVRGATNQQMELRAAIEAVEYVAYNHIVVPFDAIEVITDSAYLHNCYTQKWYRNWQLNGWVNSKKQPVANRDLWEKLITWFESPEVTFTKTKGHANDKWNNVVDEMAQKASLAMKEE